MDNKEIDHLVEKLEHTTTNSLKNNKKEPILPQPNKRNILITSALPYVNNVPHLGNIVGCVLSADVFARYCRLRGYNTIYICGTDEYGTATETKALQEGISCQELCDKYHVIHRDTYEWFDISFDYFGRTTTRYQTEIAQDIFKRLHNNGYLKEDQMQQFWCPKCERYLADRYVTGTCPECKAPDARGDQCDSCQKLLNSIDLLDPKCKLCQTTPVKQWSTHLFLDLPQLAQELNAWVEQASSAGRWSANAIATTKAWLRTGLQPRCITRDLKWGTPVPLPGYENKVFYVWFDAPIGYISITANYTDRWQEWWLNPHNVQLYQFMGKDNIPFHTVIFPATLLGTKQNWTLLHTLSTTEYLTYEGEKFSKTKGIGVFGTDAKTTGIPSEIWRYYLLANRPETGDSDFLWDDFKIKNNNELLPNLGNLINRILKFCYNTFDRKVPKPSTTLSTADTSFINAVNNELKNYINLLESVSIKEGLKVVMTVSRLGNQYMQEQKVWDVIKHDPERAATVTYVAVNLVKLLSILIEPYMPSLTRKILSQLNHQHSPLSDTWTFEISPGHTLNEPQPLIRLLTDDEISKWRKTFGGRQTNDRTPFPLDIRIGRIVKVELHPDSSVQHLFVLTVDLGNGDVRQIVSGLRGHYTPEELINQYVAILCNLKAAKFKGVLSQGMLLTAETTCTAPSGQSQQVGMNT